MATDAASRARASQSSTSGLQDTLALAGRILVALMFIPAGISKITGFDGTVGHIAAAGLPLPALGAVLTIVVEVGAGLLFLLGLKTRWMALVLVLFTLVASVFFHKYWAMEGQMAYMNQLMFFKNLAVTGGLLAVAAFGGGAFSVDASAVFNAWRHK
ncbi:DoxX family protein [Ramlibacter sp. H39-3-26]|uniref:DoxX family protein n=1 Tax=Curvibacter soli TaxID=3031331 RepID=UPI0023DB2A4D|nr:DoxX family protein [Ramlibacter sp. H39-3-26]MDF1485127.1 DoxX family protein [Ramlibacter sp. H39-3-26]